MSKNARVLLAYMSCSLPNFVRQVQIPIRKRVITIMIATCIIPCKATM
jgi:hypothetical protein